LYLFKYIEGKKICRAGIKRYLHIKKDESKICP